MIREMMEMNKDYDEDGKDDRKNNTAGAEYVKNGKNMVPMITRMITMIRKMVEMIKNQREIKRRYK